MTLLIAAIAINAAIAAAYYLRIVATMVLEPSAAEEDAAADGQAYEPPPAREQPWPIVAATALSVAGIFAFGLIPPNITLAGRAAEAAAESALLAAAEPLDAVVLPPVSPALAPSRMEILPVE